MSENLQKLLLYFGVAMVGMIALLVGIQFGFASLTVDEPQMINARSLAFAAFFAAGIALCFGPSLHDGGRRS